MQSFSVLFRTIEKLRSRKDERLEPVTVYLQHYVLILVYIFPWRNKIELSTNFRIHKDSHWILKMLWELKNNIYIRKWGYKTIMRIILTQDGENSYWLSNK